MEIKQPEQKPQPPLQVTVPANFQKLKDIPPSKGFQPFKFRSGKDELAGCMLNKQGDGFYKGNLTNDGKMNGFGEFF